MLLKIWCLSTKVKLKRVLFMINMPLSLPPYILPLKIWTRREPRFKPQFNNLWHPSVKLLVRLMVINRSSSSISNLTKLSAIITNSWTCYTKEVNSISNSPTTLPSSSKSKILIFSDILIFSVNDFKVCRELEKNDLIGRLGNVQAPQGFQPGPPVQGYNAFGGHPGQMPPGQPHMQQMPPQVG